MALFDVIVIGLGVTGAATLRELARRGFRAVGIEQFTPGHDRGSSHGETRIVRLSYFEHPSYVPLLRKSYQLWRELETLADRKLLRIGGILEIGPPHGVLVSGTLAASREHGLPHEILDRSEIKARYPQFRLPSDFVGVFQPDGGFVAAESAVQTLMAMATAAKAEVRTGVRVDWIEPQPQSVRVGTSAGVFEARTAVVSVGAWLNILLPGVPAPLRATREVMGWFKPADAAAFAPSEFPVFILESEHGQHYGFPASPAGLVKVAKHHHRDETVLPDDTRRPVSELDISLIRAALADHLPAANGALADAKTCMYTMTPDHHFVIDVMPGAPHVIVASPCSGHGFKFAPVMGEILADLATEGGTEHDIRRFRMSRFR